MTLEEVALVLTKDAAFSQRTVGRSDVLAWHEVIGGSCDLPDAMGAVTEHYARTRDRLMPVDVLDFCKELQVLRVRETPVPLPSADPDDSVAYRDQHAASIAAIARPHRRLEVAP